jgi:exonuclease SbcC
MIPVKLTIQGLYSYQEKQTIDFTKLTSANLFGIFGAVGSGKSSVLEAITFAIYGKTDRLNLSGDNRNYNMMNLKSDELLIDFIFETGKAQTAYRAVVRGRRNSKRFDDVKTLDRTAYQNQNGEWLPIECQALEHAIGLNYDNFKRTIIIPQGQFQEFLQLGNKDRTQMMKELFKLEKFELFYKVTSLESKNNAQKQHIEGQLQQLGMIDPEQVKQYETQLLQLKNELDELTAKLSKHQAQDSEWRQLQELTKKLAEAQLSLKQLKEQEPQFEKLELAIRQYELCALQFKYLLDSLESSDKKLVQKSLQIKQDSEKLEKEEVQIAKLDQALSEIKPEYEKREELKQRAEELVKLLKIKELDQNIQVDRERLKKGDEIWQQTLEKAKQLQAEKEKLEIAVKSKKAKLPDLGILALVKAWHVEKQGLDRQTQDLKKETVRFQQEEKTIKDGIQKHCSEPLFAGLAEGSDGLAAVRHLCDKTEETKKKLKQLEQEADHFRVKAQLKVYGEKLADNEPCPLCGSVHHPVIYDAGSIGEELDKFEKARLAHENEMELISKTINQLNELDNQLKFTSRHLKDLALKEETLKQQFAAHESAFKWDKYRDNQELDKAFGEANAIQSEIKKQETYLEELGKTLDKALKDKERFQTEIEKIRTSLTVLQTETKTLNGQLRAIQSEQYLQKPVAEINDEKERLLQQHARLEKQYTDLGNQLTTLRKSKDTLGGTLSANRKELGQEQETNRSIKNQLEERLQKTNFQTIDEVKQILSREMALEQENQKLTDFKNKLAICGEQAANLQKEVGERVYDAEAHRKLLAEIMGTNTQVQQKNQELGKVAELLKKLQKDLENQAVLRKQLEVLEFRAENLRTLKSLFKGSGFVNYISSVYLQNLCNAANDRFFQLTRQKLSLEITADNNFQVRDFMNGGKLRSVKTLSGGQTFQAALSLALALADNIQKITESNQNFFFLDEGFGSLDKESLSVVFDTLKSLRRENRIVGVISHVEEMQQEIEVHLRVENDEERGSKIYPNWTA